MHPMVKPALRRGWRDLNTVQFGLAPAHAMTLGPVDPATAHFLDLINGTRGLPLLREEARRMRLPDGHADAVVDRLARSGLLDDARGGGPRADALRAKQEVLDRLRPDLASLSVTTSEPGDALARLAARRAMRVRVLGAGRVGAVVASLLSGAGVGEVDVRDIGTVEPWDVAPGGLPAESVGEHRAESARRAALRAAPDRPPRRSPGPAGPDGDPGLSLVVLAPRDDVAVHAPAAESVRAFLASGTPHLYAGVVEATGVVGPLVLPGVTGCAGCLHESRTDRDPTWPRLVAQWRSGRQRRVGACDLTLAMTVAGLAAAHALAFLDGRTPSGAGVRWEVSLPVLQWHARPVLPHPSCPCGAAEKAAEGEAVEPAGERAGRTAAETHERTTRKGETEHPSEKGAPHATMAGQRSSTKSFRTPGTARPSGTWRAHV
ncbi:TOMM precursor leader peptide-binding protein [Streptomyces sp. NPDC091377]|uniref:TOMM precursor leader peptide-binding protein n=1 Tax=Streptomyces sp. NPDC091377 TaxID=3365995 RepID=UPI0037F3EC90